MAGDKSDSAPGARGDEPREPGAFCVTNGDAVVRIDERGNVLMNGKVIGFDPSFVQPKRTLQYDISVIGTAAVEKAFATFERRFGRARARARARDMGLFCAGLSLGALAAELARYL